MSIRMSGLMSGLDTESIIKELMSAQNQRKTKIENKKTKLEWKEEKWKELNTKLYDLYCGDLSKMKTQGTFLTKSVASSDESKVTFSASSKVPVGTHSVSIEQVASAQYITGAKIKASVEGNETAVMNSTKLTDVTFETGDGAKSIPIGTVLKLKVGNNETSYFAIDENTTISDISGWCKNNNVTFNYDRSSQRFFISSSLSGGDNAFTLTSTNDAIEDRLHLSYLDDGNKRIVYNAMDSLLFSSESDVGIKDAKKSMAAGMKAIDQAKADVYRKYMEENFNAKAPELGGTDASLVWKSDNHWEILCDNEETKANLENAMTEIDSKYNFNEYITSGEDVKASFNTFYSTHYENNMNVIASVGETKKSASEILDIPDGDSFISNLKVIDPFYKMAGGKQAYDVLSETERETFREAIHNKDKDQIEKYAKADYIAQKEAYKSYVEEEFNKIPGADHCKITWDTDGTYKIEKTTDDTTVKLSEIRKSLKEKINEFDLEKQIAESPESNCAKVYKEVFTKIGIENTSYESPYQPNIDATQYTEKIHSSLETLTTVKPSEALTLMGIGEISSIPTESVVTKNSAGATVVAAQDLKCTYNGCEYVSDSNVLTINGLTINAIDVTSSAVKATVTNDTSKVYDAVKAFCKSYNEVLKEMNTLYYAKSAKEYDMLTDEQREAMGEKSAEKWDNKIKDSLLRRDSTMQSIISAMRSITSKSVTVNGKAYNLAYFGINTSDYTEKGLLHIDGDKEDTKTSLNQDKLMQALSDDPDVVMQVITTLSGELYSTLTEKMASTKLSSALTFYNDKEMSSLKKTYEDDLKELEKKLSNMETSYYKKFAAMESAMSKINSQSSYLSSLFNTNG